MLLFYFVLIVASTAFPVDFDELTFTEDKSIGFDEIQQLNSKSVEWHYQRTEYDNGLVIECKSDWKPKCKHTGSASEFGTRVNVTQMRKYHESDGVEAEVEHKYLVTKFFCHITSQESKCTVSYGYNSSTTEIVKSPVNSAIRWIYTIFCFIIVMCSVISLVYVTVLVSNFLRINSGNTYKVYESQSIIPPSLVKL